MKMRPALLIFILHFFLLQSYGQTTSQSIDRTLTDIFKKLQESEYEMRYDSIAPLFKQQVKKYLSSPLTFENKLDSLETFVRVVRSPDKKIKFYSWDELTGGTWHEVNVFAQFRGSSNQVFCEQIDTDKEMEVGGFTDSEILEINEIKENGKTFYVTFGWGTHGNGNQHMIIQVFQIVGDNMIRCKAFNKEQAELVIEYPRTERLQLEFNKTNNSFSFNEFTEPGEEQFAQRTGKRKNLRFINGSFK